MKTIWFIRHAESEANAGLAKTYPDTIPLTLKGFTQARLLAEPIATEPDLIITSPYLRTQQTAQPLADKYPLVPTERWPKHEFNFLSPITLSPLTVRIALRQGLVFGYFLSTQK
jgi:probable phosphoglycerate mutase